MSDFLQRLQTPVETSAGPMDFPILYRDTGGFMAFFKTDAEKVHAELAGTGLVAPSTLGKAMVGVAFFTYRDCTIDFYNEAAVAVMVRPEAGTGHGSALLDLFKPASKRQMATHILQLPVTTEQARAGGVEVYGYPKFVADIDVAFDGRSFRGVTREKETGDDIVRLEGSSRLGIPLPGSDILTWSIREGVLLKTHIELDARFHVSPGWGFQLRVGNSMHAMAQQLRRFGLESARPLMVMRCDHYQVVLPTGVPTGV